MNPFLSFRSRKFDKHFALLPVHIQALAVKCYRMWNVNPWHPSLNFEPLGKSRWSVRVGDHYRVMGIMDGNKISWYWIGTHEAYNKLLRQ